MKSLLEQGRISQRVRTGPNLGLVLGDIKNAWVVLSQDKLLILSRDKTSPNSL